MHDLMSKSASCLIVDIRANDPVAVPADLGPVAAHLVLVAYSIASLVTLSLSLAPTVKIHVSHRTHHKCEQFMDKNCNHEPTVRQRINSYQFHEFKAINGLWHKFTAKNHLCHEFKEAGSR